MEDDKIADRATVCPTVPQEKRMNEQDSGPVTEARQLMAEDTALQLFQIAALMLGDEQEAVSLVEEVVAKVEADPCAEGTLAYAEARTLLVRTAVQRMAGLYPEAFVVPTAQPADAVCIETDDLGAAGLSGDQFGALISGAGARGCGNGWNVWRLPCGRFLCCVQWPDKTVSRLRRAFARAERGGRRHGGETRLGPRIARRCARWLPA